MCELLRGAPRIPLICEPRGDSHRSLFAFASAHEWNSVVRLWLTRSIANLIVVAHKRGPLLVEHGSDDNYGFLESIQTITNGAQLQAECDMLIHLPTSANAPD